MQRYAFRLAVAANFLGVLMNGGFFLFHLMRGDGWEVSLAYMCAAAVVLWVVITTDARARTKQATFDSYLEEQLADTRIKQFLAEKVCSGAVEFQQWPGPAETNRRQH